MKYLLSILFIVSVFTLSSCELMLSRAPEEGQRQIIFSCAGSTNVILRDYCVTDDSIKLLIANMNINDVTDVIVEIMGTRGSIRREERLLLEMEEFRLLKISIPSNIGNPIDVTLTPKFLSGRGIEFCREEVILFESIRKCS